MTQPDPTLIAQCKKGDQRALQSFYDLCFPDMYKVVFRYGRHEEDVQELINLSFMKILKGMDQYREHEKFGQWVRTIAINTALDFVRSRHRRETWFTEVPLENLSDSLDENQWWSESDATTEIWNHMAQLPDQHRLILNLFAIEGYSHREIAERLQIAETASRWYVSEARRQLKRSLTQAKII
jgi:RNA polymerase sigma factor (sigma-70 family)